MKLLDRLVLKETVPMFFVGVAMFFSLWFAADPMMKAIKYMSQGVPPIVVLKVIGWSVPTVLALTFPMGMLLASLIGFGRLSADSEAVALYAGGIPFRRIVASAFVLAAVVSVIGFWLSDKLASVAYKRLEELGRKLPDNFHDTTNPIDFQVSHKDGSLNYLVHVEKGFDLGKKELRQVTIVYYDKGKSAPTAIVYADRAKWEFGKHWRLYDQNGYALGEVPIAITFNAAELGDPGDVPVAEKNLDGMTFGELRGRLRAATSLPGRSSKERRKAEVKLWSKLALPLAALVFTMIGVPLGLQPQRGSKFVGWVISILIIFLYYVLYTVLCTVAQTSSFPPALAVFMPDIIGCSAGAFMMWKRSLV